MQNWETGMVVRGKVKSIADFGALIDLNGLNTLLHISNMSWERISHPSEVVAAGEEIEGVVLDVNHEEEQVSLGLKQMTLPPAEG